MQIRMRTLGTGDFVLIALHLGFWYSMFMLCVLITGETASISPINVVWGVAIFGMSLAAMQVYRWKTKRPVPLTYFGIGIGCFALSQSLAAAEVLLSVYYQIRAPWMWSVSMVLLAMSVVSLFTWAFDRGK